MTRGLGGESPANVATYLKGIDYPVGKGDLVKYARQNGAAEDVINILENIPEQQYANMADVMKGYGDAN